jgi:hypothetical protein
LRLCDHSHRTRQRARFATDALRKWDLVTGRQLNLCVRR